MNIFGKNLKTPAANGRFCEMAAVTPQTILCGFARYYPAERLMETATAPSRWDVVCHMGTARWTREIYDDSLPNCRKLKKT